MTTPIDKRITKEHKKKITPVKAANFISHVKLTTVLQIGIINIAKENRDIFKDTFNYEIIFITI